jgi:hypothetical protein
VTSLSFQCLDVLRDDIAALGLAWPDAPRIKVRKHPKDSRVYYEGITVSPQDIREGGGTNLTDDIGYGCLITICRSTQQDLTAYIDRFTTIEQTIRQALIHQKLGSINTNFTVRYEPHLQFDDTDYRKDWDVSNFVLRCWIEETRT